MQRREFVFAIHRVRLCGAERGHARSTLYLLLTVNEKDGNPQTIVAQDARAHRVLKKLGGATRKYKLNMVYN